MYLGQHCVHPGVDDLEFCLDLTDLIAHCAGGVSVILNRLCYDKLLCSLALKVLAFALDTVEWRDLCLPRRRGRK